jgi:hypothetical protein
VDEAEVHGRNQSVLNAADGIPVGMAPLQCGITRRANAVVTVFRLRRCTAVDDTTPTETTLTKGASVGDWECIGDTVEAKSVGRDAAAMALRF